MRAIRVLLLVLAAMLLQMSALAQRGPAFSRKDFPSGMPAQRNSQGKLIYAMGNGGLSVWSAATRNWQWTAVGPSATVFLANDLLLVRDGSQWIGFGATRGRFDAIPASATSQLLNPASQNNDSIALVRDGGLVHAFSGITGRWTSRAIAPTAAIVVQRHVALALDGTLASGFDAFHGAWHDQQLDGPAATLSADGVCGVCSTAATAYGFSSVHGAWTSHPCSTSAQLTRNDDWAVWHDGSSALGYSGLVNGFSSLPLGPLTASAGDDLFGLFMTAGLAHAFSAFTGTWSSAPMSANASVRVSSAVALLIDGVQLHGYSAPRGVFVPLALDASADAIAGSMVAVQARATGRAHLFSALTANWSAAPQQALPGLPTLSTTGAMLRTQNGVIAFSSRTNAFVPRAMTQPALEANLSSSPLLAWDANEICLFDGRRDQWVTTPRLSTGPLSPQIWRTSGFVMDGGYAQGFSTYGGSIQWGFLPAPLHSFRVNSESVALYTADAILAFSAVPEPVPMAQFPEFRRAAVVGSPLLLHLRHMPNEVGFLAIGTPVPQSVVVPVLGEVVVDPHTAATLLMTPEPDADRSVFSVQIPADPVLQGASAWFQALMLDQFGSVWATDSSAVFVG
ncbi:MAG: hypothetical protein RLZZ562_2545 [Planctomycetota bacterium]|jgi:hypothetical protein